MRQAELDYHEIVTANIRLALFLKQKGLEVPGPAQITKMFPLTHYEVMRPSVHAK